MTLPRSPERLEAILEQAVEGAPLTESAILRLLSVRKGGEEEALFSAARTVRSRHTGDRVFLYGFLYLSTYCRNDCLFCYYRSSNPESPRYRKTPDQVVHAARVLTESGVHLIDLTMGEDPAYRHEDGIEEMAGLVASVARAAELPVMISPGVVDEGALAMLRDAGATWYACYQETHDRDLFREIRPGQDFDRRLEGKRAARRLGLLTEEGMLSGLGEPPRGTARTLGAMAELETDQVRAMSFVPQRGTPFAHRPPGDPGQEARIIAVLRLLCPDRLIPASLDVGGLAGLEERLRAGANVVTSLVPPGEGLAGVAQSTLDIEDARRTAEGVRPVLDAAGLCAATPAQYRGWVEERRRRNGRVGSGG